MGCSMSGKENLRGRISSRIARSKRLVFMREDFEDLGASYSQVGRILRKLVDDGKLIRIGYGLYARSKVSSVTGNIVTDGPLPWLAKEFLARRGIDVVPTQADIDYSSRRSTQVPTGRTIGVRSRVTRRISFNGSSIAYELRP